MQQQQQSNEVRKQQQHGDERAGFDALLEPLERLAGRRLAGKGRASCLRAYRRSPEFFAEVVRDAQERAHTSPLGFLCRLIDDGDHLDENGAGLAPLGPELERRRSELGRTCPQCGLGGGHHVADCRLDD